MKEVLIILVIVVVYTLFFIGLSKFRRQLSKAEKYRVIEVVCVNGNVKYVIQQHYPLLGYESMGSSKRGNEHEFEFKSSKEAKDRIDYWRGLKIESTKVIK